MAILGSILALTVLDDVAGVGPLKVTRVSFAGDAAYHAGGSLGLAAALNAAVKENRTIVGAQPTGKNGDVSLEYTPAGKLLPCSVVPATPLFSTATAHGFAAGDPVQFFANDIGNDNPPAPKLPTGIVAGTTYYVIAAGLTATAFEVSAAVGGASIAALSDAGGQFEVQKQDTLFVRVMDTGAESATADQSGSTYSMLVFSY